MSKEILKKVRQIEIRTKNIVNDFFGGDYHSNFKGRGMTFSEVREYEHGDDVRFIDWNVTARTGKPHIKVFEEERELTVLLLIDVSSSGVFGSKSKLKIDLGVEIAAMLGFSSTFTFPTNAFPSYSFDISSTKGPTILHGPHHSAQKSTNTGLFALITNSSKLSSVNSSAIILYFFNIFYFNCQM